MSLTLAYDGSLSRVQITGTSNLNANPFFETNATNWTGSGGTVARSTVQFHQGAASLLLTPDGVTASVEARSEMVPATVGRAYRGSTWVRCAVSRNVAVGISWYTSGSVFISQSVATTAVVANVWTLLAVTATAPATATQARLVAGGMSATPAVGNTVYIDQALLEPSPIVVERSTNQIVWTTVRGGSGLASTDGNVSLDDYEFAADVTNYYRLAGQTASITPTLDGVWLKSVARPFLNRTVEVADIGDITRPSRAGVFQVVGRSLPVAVTDVRGSRSWPLYLQAADMDEASRIDLTLASGDILFVQAPTTGRLAVVPTAYVSVGDTVEQLLPTAALDLRVLTLPCTEVAAPTADVVGATSNWQTVINGYASWSALVTAKATWADVLELVGDPTDVIVS